MDDIYAYMCVHKSQSICALMWTDDIMASNTYTAIINVSQDVLAQLESRCKHLQEQNETLLKTASAALATWQRSVEQNSALLDRILWMGSCKNVD